MTGALHTTQKEGRGFSFFLSRACALLRSSITMGSTNRKGITAYKELAERLWAKVTRGGADECWLWCGRVEHNGVGVLTSYRNHIRAHKAAYMVTNNTEVPTGKYVIQTCNNRLCCNPSHLILSDKRRRNGDKTEEDRFWGKVNKDGPMPTPGKCDGNCWEWRAKILQSTGYGEFSVRNDDGTNGSKLAHRMSYELTFGEIPDGMNVCHACDNRKCLRPEHLFAGTQKENVQDAIAKNRWAKEKPNQKGEKSHKAKLTEEEVLEIRRLHATGTMGYRKLSAKFGVNTGTIRAILIRQTWRHI